MLGAVVVRELPSYRVAYVGEQLQNPVTPSTEINGIHANFLSWQNGLSPQILTSDLFGIERTTGQKVTHGAIWHADWSGPQSQIVEFKLCMFIKPQAIDFADLQSALAGGGVARRLGLTMAYTAGGLYAVTEVKGAFDNIPLAVNEMVKQWLPNSPYRQSGGPWVEIYSSVLGPSPSVAAVSVADQVTEVCCPVIPRASGSQVMGLISSGGRFPRHGEYVFNDQP